MSELPPNFDLPDDIDDRYRRLSALDPSRPSDGARAAILAHAMQVAADKGVAAAQEADHPGRGARGPTSIVQRTSVRRTRWWHPTVFGTLAAAGLVGLLVLPRIIAPPTAQRGVRMQSDVANYATRAPAAPEPTPMSPARQEEAPMLPAPPAAPASAAAAASSGTLNEVVVTGARRSRSDSMTSSAIAAMPAPNQVNSPVAVDPQVELLQSVQIGDLRELKKSIEDHADINARDETGRTALMVAVQRGDIEAVKLLLSRGADPNIADSAGVTPLAAATARGNAKIRKALERVQAR